MRKPGDIDVEEGTVEEIVGRLVAVMELATSMLIIPKGLIDAYMEETGSERPPESLDMFNIIIEQIDGTKVNVLLSLPQAKDLAMNLLQWHKDMHEAGKCDHD